MISLCFWVRTAPLGGPGTGAASSLATRVPAGAWELGPPPRPVKGAERLGGGRCQDCQDIEMVEIIRKIADATQPNFTAEKASLMPLILCGDGASRAGSGAR